MVLNNRQLNRLDVGWAVDCKSANIESLISTAQRTVRVTRSQSSANVVMSTFLDEPMAVLETEDEVRN